MDIVINRPRFGFSNISDFINNAIILAFIIAIVIVLAMLVWGAIQWIFSGGDKEALGAARGRIINSLIGITILAVAFAIFQLAGTFLGFPVGPGSILQIPTPTSASCTPPSVYCSVGNRCLPPGSTC